MNNWIQSNFDGILVGIIASFIFSIIGNVVKCLWNEYKISKSKLSGVWDQQIFKKDDTNYVGPAIKRDVYEIKHNKLRYTGRVVINIKGVIKREFPVEKNYKVWDFIGYLDGDVLTILFQSQEGRRSRGCIYARLYQDYEFRGYYLEEHDDVIDKTPLIIRKRGN